MREKPRVIKLLQPEPAWRPPADDPQDEDSAVERIEDEEAEEDEDDRDGLGVRPGG
jgi:hypothetical protein